MGDNVFIESQRPDQPYYICNITEFKKSKRDTFVVVVRWFYRTTEVPETVYNFLIKDRHTEHGSNAIQDPLVKSRELFISNATDQFPINVLRGKCDVTHCTDIMAGKTRVMIIMQMRFHHFILCSQTVRSCRRRLLLHVELQPGDEATGLHPGRDQSGNVSPSQAAALGGRGSSHRSPRQIRGAQLGPGSDTRPRSPDVPPCCP